MTQDEIIEMASDSGMDLYGLGKDRYRFVHHLETFAKLVAEKEREAILGLADSLGWVSVDHIQSRGQA